MVKGGKVLVLQDLQDPEVRVQHCSYSYQCSLAILKMCQDSKSCVSVHITSK